MADEKKTAKKTAAKKAADAPEAPKAVEPEPVTVEPAATPGLLDDFEVTPERGYRRKQS